MAKIGEVLVALRADVGQFQSGMAQASAATHKLTKQMQQAGSGAKVSGVEWEAAVAKWPHLAKLAADATAKLSESVKQLSGAGNQFQAGWASVSDILRTMTADAQKAAAALQDLAAQRLPNQFQAGWASASEIMAAMQEDAKRVTTGLFGASRATRTLTSGMTMLATSAAMVPGPLGRISVALLGLQLSLWPILAIAAAVVAVSYALNRAKKEAEALEKALEFGRSRRTREMSAIAAIASEADIRRLGSLRSRITEITAKIKELREARSFAVLPSPATEAETTLIARLEGVEEAAKGLARTVRQEAVQALAEARFRMEHVGEAAHVVEDGVKRMRLQWAGYPADVAGSIVANERLAASLETLAGAERNLRAIEEQFGSLAAAQRRISEQAQRGLGRAARVSPMQLQFEVQSQAGLDIKRQMEGAIKPATDHVGKAMKEAGVMGMTALVMGFVEGGNKMKDFLKNFVMAFLEMAISAVVRSVLKIGSPSKVAMGWGMNVAQGLAMGMKAGSGMVRASARTLAQATSPSFSLQVSVPNPGNPMILARDRQWQESLRESLLVAQRGGFKLA